MLVIYLSTDLNFYIKISKIALSFDIISLIRTKSKEKGATLLMINFYKPPIMLITNLNPMDKRLSLTILKTYLKRWKIEECFRLKKQFDFENIRVRSLNSISTINLLLSITIGFIGMFSQKRKESILVIFILKISKRIYDILKFDYYALSDGIYTILQKTKKLVLKNS